MLSNSDISELLARQAESEDEAPPHRRRAFKRAARAALSWDESAWKIVQCEGSLSKSLRGVGPYLSAMIRNWVKEPPPVPDPPTIRRGFISRAEVKEQLLGWPCFVPPVYGDLHTHTDWSDGKNSLWEMAEAAEERGYSYLAVTDHAAKLKIAGGLSAERLAEQGGEIRAANERLKNLGYRVRLLRSSELNFDAQGQVDYDAHTLRELDLTIGAFHSKLRLTDDQTERYLRAVENPLVDVLAHPACRIFNFRKGLTADWRRVMERAVVLGKAVEIDGIPDRQDMGPELLTIAAEVGVYVSLGSDSHSNQQLRNIDFALAAALKAGVAPERVLNFMSLEELKEWRKRRLASSSAAV